MEVLVLSYKDILPKNIESLRLSASKMGWTLREMAPHELTLKVSSSGSDVFHDGVKLHPQAVIHRTVAKFMPLISPILELWIHEGICVLNHPIASMSSRSKLQTTLSLSKTDIPFLETHFFYPTTSPNTVDEGPFVVKPVFGVQGRDIEFVTTKKDLDDYIRSRPIKTQDLLVEPLLIQRDLGHECRDIRAHVVGGKCVALMQRNPQKGKRLANLAQGGTSHSLPLTHPAKTLAERAVDALGLDFAGVDLLELDGKLFVSEVDAWAGFAGIEETTNLSVSMAILELIQSRVSG